jgi:predicted Fe-Mo cluster-binding NifX family protein
MSRVKVAIPVENDLGLDSLISGHFGHSPGFMIADISNGEVEKAKVVLNAGHSSCAEPVQMLAQNGVTVLIARGMGMRPLMHSQNMGIRVVISQGNTVRDVIENYLTGNIRDMSIDQTCGGGHHH